MSLRNKLFYLGNEVVALTKKIDQDFPVPLNGISGQQNVLRDTLFKLLDIINEIRLAVQSETPKDSNDKKVLNWRLIKVECSDQDMDSIKLHIEFLQLNYETIDPFEHIAF